MAFKASKAIESHKTESHESRRGPEPGGNPAKANPSYQKPIKSHFEATRVAVRQTSREDRCCI